MRVSRAARVALSLVLVGCGTRGHGTFAPPSLAPSAPAAPSPSPLPPQTFPSPPAREAPQTPAFGASEAFPPLPSGDLALETLPQGPLELGDSLGWFKGTTVRLRFFPRPSVGSGRSANHHADLFIFLRSDGTPIDAPFLLEAVPKGAAGPSVEVPDEVARAFSTRWEVHLLRMADGYDPSDPAQSIDSTSKLVSPLVLEDLETNLVLDCPVLPPLATIPEDPAVVHEAVWNGHRVRIATYDVTDAPPSAIPLYVFERPDHTFSGRPVVVRIPGQPNYSSLWDVRAVQVPVSYVRDSIRSLEDVLASKLPVRSLGFQVNCPVTAVEGGSGLVPVTHEDFRSILFGPAGKFSDRAFPIERRHVPFESDRVFRIVARGLSTDDRNHNFDATAADPSFPLVTLTPTPDVGLERLIHDASGRLVHLEQADLDRGALTPPIDANVRAFLPASATFIQKLALVGKALFEHEWTKEEGSGPLLNRLSCAACHGGVATGGGGPAMFSVQQAPGPDTLDAVPAATQLALALEGPALATEPAILRRTPHVFGAGLKDELARERFADGSDAAPFLWKRKGTVASLRAFTVGALAGELGIEAVERIAASEGVSIEAARSLDPDGDGVANEATPGDVTALVVFEALLPEPSRQPVLGLTTLAEPVGPDGLLPGERLFQTALADGGLGCARCHTPEIPLRFTSLAVSNPETGSVLGLPLPAVAVRAYSDFRRHKLGSLDAEGAPQEGVAADVFLTKELWGLGSSAPYLHDGRAGNDVAAAIEAHRGQPLVGATVRVSGGVVLEAMQTNDAVTLTLPAGTALVSVTAPAGARYPLHVAVTAIDTPGASVGAASLTLDGPTSTAPLTVVDPTGLGVTLELVVADEAGASEALPEIEAWRRLAPAARGSVVHFLRSLRLGNDMASDRGFEVENP